MIGLSYYEDLGQTGDRPFLTKYTATEGALHEVCNPKVDRQVTQDNIKVAGCCVKRIRKAKAKNSRCLEKMLKTKDKKERIF